MSDSRRLVIRVDLDSSNVGRQANATAKTIESELAKQKASVDKLVSDMMTSGGKLKVPMEQFTAATKTTIAVLDKLAMENAAALDKLYPKYDELKAKRDAAWKAGDNMAFGNATHQIAPIEREIKKREELLKKIQQQYVEVEKLTVAAEKNSAKTDAVANSEQTLAQQLAQCKKRMSELIESGQMNSKEYQEQSTKAKELARSIQQLNNDAKPDAQVRLRTALMNAKQAMHEAAEKFGRGSVEFARARDEAVRLQQAMNGMNKQIKNLAAPNATYQGIINGLSGISGAASAATGAMALFGGESQQTAQAMAKLQAIMSITMGLQSMSMMLNQNSALQLNIIGRLTEWWTRCKAKAAAATIAETSTIATNTVATSTNAAATNTAAVATQRATTANKSMAVTLRAVGIAMKSIPIIGWIAAIGTLVLSIYKLHKSYDYAREAKKELSRAIKEANKTASEELATVKALYAATQNNTLSMEKRRAAANKMQDLYPDIFKNLKTEAILAGDAAQAYKELTQAILNKAKAEARKSRIQQIEQQRLENEQEFRDQAAEWVKKYNEALFGTGANIAGLTVEEIIQRGGLTDMFNTEGNPGAALAEWNINRLISEYLKPNQERQREQDRLTREIAELEETPESERRAATEGDPLYYRRLMEQAQNNADNHLLTQEERIQAQRDYYKYRRLYEKTRFNPKDRTTALGDADIASQNIEDVEIQSERERVRKLTDLARQLEQARIDVMADGAERRERQRLLDNQREQDEIYNQMQSEIEAEVARQKALWDAREAAKAKAEAAQGRQYRKQAFNAGDILRHDFNPGDTTDGIDAGNVSTAEINRILAQYGFIQSLTITAQQRHLNFQIEAEQQAMNEYLQQYGTYEEKKTAIAAVYAAKRAKAATDAEQMQLAQEESKALNDVEFDDFMTNRAALAFGEIDNLSRSTISRLINEMEKYRDKITQTFDPDKIEKFNRALSDLKRAKAMSEGGIFSQLFTPEFFKERSAALLDINTAEQTHNDLLTAKAQKEEEVKRKIEEIIVKVKELTGKDLTPDQVRDGSTISNIIGQLGANGNQQGAADLSILMNGLNGARVELGQVTYASNQATASLEQLKGAFTAKFTGQGGGLAMVDTIVHGINDIVQGANDTVKELASTAEALGADTSVGSGWDKAQTFMQGFADASAGATEAFESLKNGNVMGVVSGVTKSFTSWIKAFAAIHDASRERTIQRLQDEIDELERMNRRIEHSLEKQYSKQASRSYDEEIKNLEKQRQLILQQIAAEEDKKNTDDDRIQEWKDQYEELGWQIDEYKDKALDAILGEDISSSIENFADMLADAWGKTGERARATKELVKDLLRQMVIEAMKTDLTEPIKKLREMMAKALDDDVITAQEQAELEAFAQQLADETERRYNWADNIMNDGVSDSGSGTTGTFATASQDSITELSGRAAAIHTSGEMRRELLAGIQLDTDAIRAEVTASRESAIETRNLQLIAVGHLETIARNTNELYVMNERLDKIERNTRAL